MDNKEIINKAKSLGFNTGTTEDDSEKLKLIAEQLGIDNFIITDTRYLNSRLDDLIQNRNNNNSTINKYNFDKFKEYQDNPNKTNTINREEQIINNNRDDGIELLDSDNNKDNINNNVEDNKEEVKVDRKEPDNRVINTDNNTNNDNEVLEYLNDDDKKENTSKVDSKDNNDNEELINNKRNLHNTFGSNRNNIRHNNLRNNQMLNNKQNTSEEDSTEDKNVDNNNNNNKPQDNIKNNVKNAAKEEVKQVAREKVKEVVVKFVRSHPLVLVVAFVVILILFIIILLFASSESNTSEVIGYYDSSCNFNATNIELYSCTDSNSVKNISLKDYVLAITYSYITDDNILNDEQIKALMIIIKTNALANGNYNNSNKLLALDDCTYNYEDISNINSNILNNLESNYDSISDYLYIPNTYKGTITNLDSNDTLELNTNIVDTIKNDNNNFNTIISNLYNNDNLTLYSLKDECTYYENVAYGDISNNTDWWWPIGSRDADASGLYSGEPSSTGINSHFGYRTMNGEIDGHGGLDIAASCNTDVIIASRSGKVVMSNDSCPSQGYYGSTCGDSYGNFVKIEHSDGTYSLYGHMYRGTVTVKEGDTVTQGQKIGMAGSSGSSTGCHLHFEVRTDASTRVNPEDYISPTNPRPVSGSSNTNLTGDNSNRSKACVALLKEGFTSNATIAILSNMEAESNFEWDLAGEDSNGLTSYGLVMWNGVNYTNLQEYTGKEKPSIEEQVKFLKYDMSIGPNKYLSSLYSKLTNPGYSAEDLTKAFCHQYENPANQDYQCEQHRLTFVPNNTTFVNNNCK